MDVALPANGRGVTELLGNVLDGSSHRMLAGSMGAADAGAGQQYSDSQSPCPSAKRLGGEWPSHRATQVAVHVGGREGVMATSVVRVLKQSLSRNVATSSADGREA